MTSTLTAAARRIRALDVLAELEALCDDAPTARMEEARALAQGFVDPLDDARPIVRAERGTAQLVVAAAEHATVALDDQATARWHDVVAALTDTLGPPTRVRTQATTTRTPQDGLGLFVEPRHALCLAAWAQGDRVAYTATLERNGGLEVVVGVADA